MIEEATVDGYNESERITGWFTMIEQSLAVPFQTLVFGVLVTVERVDLDKADQIVAICVRGHDRQRSHPRPSASESATRGCGMDRGVPPVA
jgi:hypothetical protein